MEGVGEAGMGMFEGLVWGTRKNANARIPRRRYSGERRRFFFLRTVS
jgi:hypothetical protein